jgi:DNA-directed RNA polymerase subunit RPC12/RpoP
MESIPLKVNPEKTLSGVKEAKLERNAVEWQSQKNIKVKYWCRDCGNQFTDKLTVSAAVKGDGTQELSFIRSGCPSCNSINTSPHVKTGTIVPAGLGGYPSFEHYVQAVYYALGCADKPSSSSEIEKMIDKRKIWKK